MNWFKKWYFKEANWYHFWRPQSGPVGGIIFGTVIVFPLFETLKYTGVW